MDLRLPFRSGHCQLEVSGIRKDLVFVWILLLLDGTLDDDRQHQCIHRQREDGDHALGNGVRRGGTDSCIHEAVGVQHGDGGEYAVVLEQGEDLGEHTPGRQGVGTVLNPAALIPQRGSNGGSQQQRHAAVPGVGRQVQVGVLEVPHIVGQNVQPDHVGPEHIVMLFGGVNPPPAGHAEDVQDARDAVEPVPPAAVEPHVFTGQPPAVAVLLHGGGTLDGGLKVAGHGNENVDGHNEEGEDLEPFRLADAPLVLEHHEADAAGGGGVELGIVEPAVHVKVGGVVQRPLGTHGGSHIDGHKVHRQRGGQNQKEENTALFRPAGDLVGENQSRKYQQPAQKLEPCPFAVDLKQHSNLSYSSTVISLILISFPVSNQVFSLPQ